MKLKAPEGAGDPCVAGAVIGSRDGLYEVEAEIAALLIECFGFAPVEQGESVPATVSRVGAAAPRRRASAKNLAAEV